MRYILSSVYRSLVRLGVLIMVMNALNGKFGELSPMAGIVHASVSSSRGCPSGNWVAEWKTYLKANYLDPHVSVWKQKEVFSNFDVFNNVHVGHLSAIKSDCGEPLYFASYGSCDGTSDKTLEQFYVHSHWKGVMVEAFGPNVEELKTVLTKHEASHRALVLEVAAMDECLEPNVTLRSPIADPRDEKVPHWLRRQSSSVPTKEQVEKNKLFPKVWRLKEVPCMTGADTARAFGKRFGHMGEHTPISDILKIDVEGASVPVLRSILEANDLGIKPLLIMVEVKTQKKRLENVDEGCQYAGELLEKHGYIVSPCTQDLFAILKPELL